MDYKVLIKKKRIYLTPNNVIYPVLMISSLMLLLKYEILGENDFNWIDLFFFGLIFLCLLLAILFSTYSLFRFQPLKGELAGMLQFRKNEIFLNNKIYLLSEISHIKLDAYDYRGKPIAYGGNLNGTKSNGTDNSLEIELENGDVISIKYQQLYKNQIIADKENLEYYCSKGKLNYASLKTLIEND